MTKNRSKLLPNLVKVFAAKPEAQTVIDERGEMWELLALDKRGGQITLGQSESGGRYWTRRRQSRIGQYSVWKTTQEEVKLEYIF